MTKRYWLLKTEYRYPLIPDLLEGAIFVDLGNLWNDPGRFELLAIRSSAGLGARFLTPIGPIAFDLGINLDPDIQYRKEERWALHFNIGVF